VNTIRLAFRMLSRDWRAGELTILIAAMVLAVASIGTVGFFADRVKGALGTQANLLLGADVLISGDRPLPDRFEAEASKRGLTSTPVLRFNSMVRRDDGDAAGTGAVLTDVKAVAPKYPLRGKVVLVDAANDSGTPARDIPARGVAWPDARLAARLNIKVGDALAVGDATLKVGAIVQQEPEVASGLLAIGPRLLINLDDVPATNLMQPGNRAHVSAPRRGPVDARRARSVSRRGCNASSRWASGWRTSVIFAPKCGRRWSGRSSSWAVGARRGILAAVAVALAASRYCAVTSTPPR
jgi:putative ABC transport system permease protein